MHPRINVSSVIDVLTNMNEMQYVKSSPGSVHVIKSKEMARSLCINSLYNF